MNKMTESEIQKALLEMGDEKMVEEFGIGCHNLFDQGEARCPYMDGYRCTKGAFLTSTLYGAHPSDCPLYKRGKDINVTTEKGGYE